MLCYAIPGRRPATLDCLCCLDAGAKLVASEASKQASKRPPSPPPPSPPNLSNRFLPSGPAPPEAGNPSGSTNTLATFSCNQQPTQFQFQFQIQVRIKTMQPLPETTHNALPAPPPSAPLPRRSSVFFIMPSYVSNLLLEN